MAGKNCTKYAFMQSNSPYQCGNREINSVYDWGDDIDAENKYTIRTNFSFYQIMKQVQLTNISRMKIHLHFHEECVKKLTRGPRGIKSTPKDQLNEK